MDKRKKRITVTIANTTTEYDSIIEASKCLNVSTTTLWNWLNNKTKPIIDINISYV